MLELRLCMKVKSIAEAYELNQKKNSTGSWQYGLAGEIVIFLQQSIFPAWGWIQCRKQMMSL